MKNALYIAAVVALMAAGCGDQSRFYIVSQNGRTLRIDKMTGKTHRLENGAWVEVKEVGAKQATVYKSADEKIREAYESMTDEALERELKKLKDEETVASVKFINENDDDAGTEAVEAKSQADMIKEILRVRRAQKAAAEQ